MADEPKVEALLIDPAVLGVGDRNDRLRRIAAGAFGIKPGQGTITISTMPIEGKVFIKRDAAQPDYLFPTGHPLQRMPRYDWQPAKDDQDRDRPGILAGTLLPDPDAEPAG